jgi:hypothetical protein
MQKLPGARKAAQAAIDAYLRTLADELIAVVATGGDA